MIRGFEDLAVGIITALLGSFLVAVAARDWHWFYTLRSARWLERWLGRRGARWVHAGLGIGLVALGLAIARGYRFPLFGH